MTKPSPKTPPLATPLNGVLSLETQMQICLEQAQNALARAEAVDLELDEYGHQKDNEYGQAMRFLKMSAKLGLSLSKLNGAHTNTINVTKRDLTEPPTPPAPPKPIIWTSTPEIGARQQKIYDEDEAEEGDPLPISPGSNAAK